MLTTTYTVLESVTIRLDAKERPQLGDHMQDHAGGFESDAPPLEALRVVIAEDSVMLREGMVRLLDEAGIEVVGQAGDGVDLVRKVRAHKPDVAVVDVRMPPTHTSEGMQAAIEIRGELPDVGLLVFSQYVEKHYAFELLTDSAAGVGYLLKDRVANVEHFIDALRRVASGASVLDPEIVTRLLGNGSVDDPLSDLTGREREVLQLMAEGRANQAIAEQLAVSHRSVEQHITRIFRKLDLDVTPDDHRRVLAVLKYLQRT